MLTIFSAHSSHALQCRQGSAYTSGIPELSHVLKAIELSDDEVATLIHEGLTRLADSDLISNHQQSILS